MQRRGARQGQNGVGGSVRVCRGRVVAVALMGARVGEGCGYMGMMDATSAGSSDGREGEKGGWMDGWGGWDDGTQRRELRRWHAWPLQLRACLCCYCLLAPKDMAR
jgi:hypothetical protein